MMNTFNNLPVDCINEVLGFLDKQCLIKMRLINNDSFALVNEIVFDENNECFKAYRIGLKRVAFGKYREKLYREVKHDTSYWFWIATNMLVKSRPEDLKQFLSHYGFVEKSGMKEKEVFFNIESPHNDKIITSGSHKGKRYDQIPVSYLRLIIMAIDYPNHSKYNFKDVPDVLYQYAKKKNNELRDFNRQCYNLSKC